MKQYSNYEGCTVPTAFVTKGRQRVKQYKDNTVYLNDHDEFEIELFNPMTNKVLAKIELNGVSLGSGIVLRPGERVFLERYLNESRKFLFETYEVNGGDPNVQKAIIDNGKVEVKFYGETIPLNYYCHPTIPWTCTDLPTITYTTSVNMPKRSDDFYGSVNSFYSQSNTHGFAGASASMSEHMPKSKHSEKLETGRVEKGSNSNQSFTYDHSSFNSWWSWSSIWQILPASRKPFESGDLKVFCANCGSRRKKQSHLYCSNCGTKY